MFRSPGVAALWYAWLVLAAAGLADLAVQGRDHASAVVAAILVLITGVVYVAALRPRIIADDAAVTVRNLLRDTRIPWAAVTSVELTDLVCIRYRAGPAGNVVGNAARDRAVHSMALQSSRRSRARALRKARTRAWRAGMNPAAGYAAPGYAKLPAEAQALVSQSLAALAASELDKWRADVQAEAAGATGAAGVAQDAAGVAQDAAAAEPVVTWSPAAIAALVIPVALVAIVAVIP